MKKIPLLILTTLFINSLTQNPDDCISFKNEYECELCLNTDLTNEGICIKPKKETGCLLQNKKSLDNSGCMFCKKNFALTENNSCVENTKKINNCLFKGIQDDGFTFCDVCENGFPTEEGECKEFTEDEKEIFSNCAWGYLNFIEDDMGERFSKECARCDLGYVLDDKTRQCVENNIEGCWIVYLKEGQTKCQYCDPWLGYSFNTPRKCYKIGAVGTTHISI